MISVEKLEFTEGVPVVILVTHGKAGEGLIESAEMIMGPMENVVAISLMPGQDPADYRGEIEKVLDSTSNPALILADLFCGTPSNSAAILSSARNIVAVSGLSLPMLIEAVNMRGNLSIDELAKVVIEAAQDGVKDIVEALNAID